MDSLQKDLSFTVLYRGKSLRLSVSTSATMADLRKQLVSLTGVVPHTLRLLLPKRAAFQPMLNMEDTLLLQSGLSEGQVIRMMGVLPEELQAVLGPESKKDQDRIVGFTEEDERAKKRSLVASGTVMPPQGTYIFCEFQTLHLPGIELNPPASVALRIMHKLANDYGITAIMKKHHWRVGILTEMAPVGYVGISPKCILGFNKNRGEEISLRLRTDDLKGFRKYESIKKTLLHELAHMVYDEHDEKFHALDKQLNHEAIALDWTKSHGHAVSGTKYLKPEESEVDGDVVLGQGTRLGGNGNFAASPRAAAASAALRRWEQGEGNATLANKSSEPDPDDSSGLMDFDQNLLKASFSELDVAKDIYEGLSIAEGSDAEDMNGVIGSEKLINESNKRLQEPDPDDLIELLQTSSKANYEKSHALTVHKGIPSCQQEPDPDDALVSQKRYAAKERNTSVGLVNACHQKGLNEPDPDDRMYQPPDKQHFDNALPTDSSLSAGPMGSHVSCLNKNGEFLPRSSEPDPDDADDTNSDPKFTSCQRNGKVDVACQESKESSVKELHGSVSNDLETQEFLGGNLELERIYGATVAVSSRLQQAVKNLIKQAGPSDAAITAQTLSKIFRNVMEHPNDMKFRRLRKGNPTFQRRVAKFEAALEVLRAVGFAEGEGDGGSECLVLKGHDPGLLWLAWSSLETCMG